MLELGRSQEGWRHENEFPIQPIRFANPDRDVIEAIGPMANPIGLDGVLEHNESAMASCLLGGGYSRSLESNECSNLSLQSLKQATAGSMRLNEA